MGKYINMLRTSGYDEQYRFDVLNGILKRHTEIQDMNVKGERVKFRSRKQIQDQKKLKLGKSKFGIRKVLCLTS